MSFWKKIPCQIDSVCIHGDNESSLSTAKSIRDNLIQNNLELKPLNKLKNFLNVKKFFFYFNNFTFFLTNAYSIGTNEKADHATNKEGEGWKRKGPPPASKFRLGYKEYERAAKLDKKGKVEKAKLKYKKALNFL